MSLRARHLILLAFLTSAIRPSIALAISSRTLITPTGAAGGDFFGWSVASAGDVNGDGYADVIVGAYQNDGGGSNAGRAYVYFGGPFADAVSDLTPTGAAANDFFGTSVASAGDWNGDGYDDFIVGAWSNDAAAVDAGRAYVYYGGPTADVVADRTLNGAASGDGFGISVASAGDVNGDGYADVIVGAWSNDGGGTGAGRAYVYYGGLADVTPDLTFSGAVGDSLGFSVASAGDVNGDLYDDLIVGAFNNDAGGTNAGRAYVYYGGPSADTVADLTFTGALPGDHFGISVATAGDVNADGYDDLIVGANLNDIGGTDAGRAYVYYGGPTADATADLTLTGAGSFNSFGRSVRSAGDVNGDGYSDLIVGAFTSSAGGANAGRAYVYFGGSSADATADLIFTGVADADFFGISVASAGDMNGDSYDDIIVGAYQNDAGGSDAGRAYVYGIYPFEVLLPDGGEIWTAGDPVTVAWRGHDLADIGYSPDGGASWTMLASGVGGDDENSFSLTAPGGPTAIAKVRLSYTGQPATHATSDQSDEVFRIVDAPAPNAASRLQLTATGAAAGDDFGISVASAGDVNGDSFADVIIGAEWGGGSGRAYVYYGGPSADAVADLTFTGQTAGDRFGYSVASAGDVNGDGFADLIVGGWFNDVGGMDAGRAYVYYGGPSADAVADLTFTGQAAGDHFGYSVASAGDVNGDGYADLLVGAMDNGAGGPGAGRAYVYYGGPSADAVADITITGAQVGALLGWSVASAGDVNGDHYADLIVAALAEGRAYVYFGGPSADANADLTLTSEAVSDNFGYSVASAGDVNGDGYADLLVGDFAGSGRAYVYFGGRSPDATADLIFPGAAGESLGYSVASAGDVNGDGYDDLIFGAYANDAGGADAGRAYVYFGGPADLIADLTFNGVAAGDYLGSSVASAGDVNGDGYADIIVGAPGNDAGGSGAGRAYLYDLKRYHVTAPNGGETWNVGALRTISWRGAEPADVWLSLDGGRSYDLLQSDAGGDATNSVALRVPHSPTKYARVKLTPTDASVTGVDQSDSTFTIQSSVSLLSFEASRGAEGTKLSWSSDPAVGPEGILGYRLYRMAPGGSAAGAAGAGGAFDGGVRIGGDLIVETHYTDGGGMPGATYQLIAVNGLSEELELGRVTAGEAIRGMKVWPSPVSLAGAMAGGSGTGGAIRIAFAAPAGTSGAPGGAALHDLDVAVYDIAGRRVATIARGPAVPSSSGVISLAWDGRNAAGSLVAPGTYIVRAIASSGGWSLERKIIVVR